jgi:hypothetical protein
LLLVLAIYLVAVLGAVLRHTGWGAHVHISGAVLVGLCLVAVAYQVLTCGIGEKTLAGVVTGLFAVFGSQVALGVSTLLAIRAVDTTLPLTRTQAVLPTIHVALAAVLLALAVLLAVRAHGLATATVPDETGVGEKAEPVTT